MKKVAVLYSKHSPLIDAIKYHLSDCDIDLLTSHENLASYDLIVLSNYNGDFKENGLKCHHSLLPAFNSTEPEKDAMLEGVKVTGITIYSTNPYKIIAQYPVFIHNNMHYDELKQELDYIEQTLFPLVIRKVLNNEPFEVQTLLSKSCSGNCRGCSSCNH